MDPNSRLFRFSLLAVTCFMTVGSYFCIDQPTGLQNQLQGNIHCGKPMESGNTSCCVDCLGLSPDQFNILFAVRAWTAAASVPLSGYFIDRAGNRIAGLLFSCGICLGTALFALASMHPFKHTDYMFPMLVAGRFLLGLNEAPARIVQDRITAYWFKDKELSVAFGITLTASRMGSVINFLITPVTAMRLGLTTALWFGVLLCVIGLISAVIVTGLDVWGVKQTGRAEVVKREHSSVSLRDVTKLSLEFWLINVCMLFFYSGFMPFVADSTKFIEDMYGYGEDKASDISGAVYDVSIVTSPFTGFIVDRFGGRGQLTVSVGILTAPSYILLAFTLVHPLLITIWLGFTYTITAVAVWSSVALLAPMDIMGLAMGITTSTQASAVGFTCLIIGAILGDTNSMSHSEMQHRWRLYLLPIFLNALLSSFAALAAVIVDRKRGKKLWGTTQSPQETEGRESESDTVNTGEEEGSEHLDTEPLLDISSAVIN